MEQNQQNSTLPENQTLAIEALLTGATVTDAAKLAGVDRTSVHRWMREDAGFIAALAEHQNAMRNAVRQKLLALADRAANVVEAAILTGDLGAAQKLLDGLGFFAKDTAQRTEDDPDKIEQEIRSRKRYLKMIKELHQ